MEKLSFQRDGNIAKVIINSPPANALSSSLLTELQDILRQVTEQPDIKAVVIYGEGRFFSAGADIKEFTSLQKKGEHEALARKGQTLFDEMEHFHIPIIAAIHGAALGGGLELAMACHMRIVAKNAKLGLPELTLGIIPGFAGTQRLPQYVGLPKAYEMILSGEAITGEEAASLGLANHAVEEDEVVEKAINLARKISNKSGPSIRAVMELVPYAKVSQFQEGIQQEAEKFGSVFGTEDAREGIQAFIEKRKPNFKE
ncbi:enoyl-CoA hydratase [Salirhabdus salicampi]|uniref:enoyl-CoA hydratase n=1 Tax=Salirhabdus salicampi TaxID=476102 RepID=UPI0020C4A4E8|nr:enoyl-CoA hydratase [Salirhabdus salicampi]MCP8617056.1 enoyl-CoA hydratase [Salirhabdus salicampi]